MSSVFITGYGYTNIYRFYEKSLEDLAFEAGSKALSNNDYKNIDALIISNSFSPLLQSQNLLSSLIAEDLGLKNILLFNVENGSAGGLTAVTLASLLIESGRVDNVLVLGAEKLSDYNSDVVNRVLSQLLNNDYEGFYGANLLSQYAIIASEYLREYSLNEEYLAEWPVLMHENSVETKHAQLKFKLNKERIMSSDYISYPLRQLHLPPISDGAAAVLLSSEKGSAKNARIAELKSSGIVNGPMEISLIDEPLIMQSVLSLSRILRSRVGEKISNPDVIDITDHYCIAGPIILESLGVEERGKTLLKIRDGSYRIGDKVALNVTGGLKARGNPIGATGVYQVAELSGLLKGDEVRRGFSNAEKALAIAVGGIGAIASGAYLEKV